MHDLAAHLLFVYGLFLMACGVTAVIFIGMKAKTALASGGLAGLFSLGTAYLIHSGASYAYYLGIGLTFALFCVFAWRATKTLFTVFELIPEKAPELKGKGIAFLIIGLMAIVSIFVTILQVQYLVH